MTDTRTADFCPTDTGRAPCPPYRGVGHRGTRVLARGTGRTNSGAPDLKELANATLLRLGKRGKQRGISGAEAEISCPAPPQKKEASGAGFEPLERPLPKPAWEPEIATLIDWFMSTPPPPEPFELHQGVTILRPDKFWEYLKGDIATGPGKARAFTGAFQKDLRRLALLFGGPATARGR